MTRLQAYNRVGQIDVLLRTQDAGLRPIKTTRQFRLQEERYSLLDFLGWDYDYRSWLRVPYGESVGLGTLIYRMRIT